MDARERGEYSAESLLECGEEDDNALSWEELGGDGDSSESGLTAGGRMGLEEVEAGDREARVRLRGGRVEWVAGRSRDWREVEAGLRCGDDVGDARWGRAFGGGCIERPEGVAREPGSGGCVSMSWSTVRCRAATEASLCGSMAVWWRGARA